MVNTCCVCGIRQGSTGITFHRFPSDPRKRKEWLDSLEIDEKNLKDSHRICQRHFQFGITNTVPSKAIWTKLGPADPSTDRSQRKRLREIQLPLLQTPSPCKPKRTKSATSHQIPTSSSPSPRSRNPSFQTPPQHSLVPRALSYASHTSGEEADGEVSTGESTPVHSSDSNSTQATINFLLFRLQRLQAENEKLKNEGERKPLRIESISNDDALIRLYTGFQTFQLLLTFFSFLGPVVHHLQIWGSKTSSSGKHRKTKLDPFNQLFLTLMKLRRNLHVKDLAYRFCISAASVSRYFITWVCFLYHHLREIDIFPLREQVIRTLPAPFEEKYATTYIIIDATEFYLETPTDMCLQSSTWSNYKQHNTGKVLIGCTPNGCISFVSDMYMGSISDVQLTEVSGLFSKLEKYPGVSMMADRGFTILDQLAALNIDLNIPPFLEKKEQFSPSDIKEGRRILHSESM